MTFHQPSFYFHLTNSSSLLLSCLFPLFALPNFTPVFSSILRQALILESITDLIGFLLIFSCNWTTVRIHKGLWATVSRKSLNKLVVSDCPKTYCKCNSGGRYYTDCQFDPSHENKQCMENREGTLCGKCKAGSSIALPSYRCNECDSTAKSIGIFVVVILFAIAVCLGILYFNPKLSEYLKGIFFYTQILPYIFTDLDSTSAEIARMFCTVFNSVAVGSMPVEMCLFQGLDLIDAIGLSYIIPSICAVIVSIVYILGGYRLINLHRDSPFNAFWVLIIIVFKLLVDTSMHSLACTRVDGMYYQSFFIHSPSQSS